MFKKSLYLLPALAAALFTSSCKNLGNEEFVKSPSGVEYKLYSANEDGKYEAKDAPTKLDSTKLGKFMYLQLEYRNSKDSVIFSTYEQAAPTIIPMSAGKGQGGLDEAFLMLDKGDSAVFRVNADSLFKSAPGQQLPPFIEKGSFLTFYVKSLDLKTQEEAMADQPRLMAERQKELEARSVKQRPIDEKKIQEYIQKNNLNAQQADSGVYYVITTPGTGPTAADGDLVSVKYKGSLLNGKEFDSSEKSSDGKPAEFPIGQNQIIKGWEAGIKKFNKGSKGIILIPSSMGYGPVAMSADLPGNSVLRFDIEVVDIKQGQAAQAPMPGQQPGR